MTFSINKNSPSHRVLEYNGMRLELGKRTLIMGILNATPDSFSDGGRYISVNSAVEQAGRMLEEGADILDIGGESTRPGAEPVDEQEELERVLPVIEAVRSAFGPSLPISIDTYKPNVARQAIKAGAHIINDIWGFRGDPVMAETAAALRCPAILMHNRQQMDYTDFLTDVIQDLQESIRISQDAGIPESSIILDPGIGFAKTQDHNLQLMNNLERIAALGYPVLLGTSRKRFIRSILDLPVDDVIEGTVATTVIGIMKGCSIIRVHDVKANKRAALMADAVIRS
ncbi:dihydropteroate synthase [Paenibacillus gansuensis]|uniref:Dihydropteroate synthase n=1 Tax=Paenibacillus gansuensis TaxID=306542 RepID=A0ABW5PAH8_9BACL